VLSAALTSGLILGVAGGVYGVRDLLSALGIVGPNDAGTPPEGTAMAEDDPPLAMVPLTFTGEKADGSGNGTVEVNVPEGWREIVKAELWRDFHDPTEELNLRIRADLPEKTPEEAAADYQNRNSDLANYQLLSSAPVEVSPDLPPAHELRYSYTDKGRTRYVIETFFGKRKVFLVGGYYWEGQEDLLREPIVEAIRSLDYKDGR
jgi:hypothetical protein